MLKLTPVTTPRAAAVAPFRLRFGQDDHWNEMSDGPLGPLDPDDPVSKFVKQYDPNPLLKGSFRDRSLQDLKEEVELDLPYTAELKVEIASRYNNNHKPDGLDAFSMSENDRQAAKWFRSAAEEHNTPRGHYYLATYLLGKPHRQTGWKSVVERLTGLRFATPNEKEALVWLHLASKSPKRYEEVDMAKEQLAKLTRDGGFSQLDMVEALKKAKDWQAAYQQKEDKLAQKWQALGKGPKP